MSTESESRPTVLLVDDESQLVELYALWLSDSCDVRTATDGAQALEAIDEAVDVVLLDRRMPDMTGDEVLEAIRADGYGCRVAMLTAVQPDADIVDMPFDDYLTKPIDRADVRSTVDVLLQRNEYDEQSRQFFALVSKRAALESSESIDHETSDEYHELTERIEEIRADVDETLDSLMEHDYSVAFQDI